jgi:hypothetical protein
MMPADRCSFEVVYRKDAQGEEVIDTVVVRAGISDASVTLTIPQVYNLARLLDLIPPPPDERSVTERGNNLTAVESRRARVLRSDAEESRSLNDGGKVAALSTSSSDTRTD